MLFRSAATPPNGVVSAAYDWSFDMPSAAAGVVYTVTSGALPGDLALDAIAGNAAHIHGTPSTAGTFAFELTATNDYGVAAQSFSITIVEVASLPGAIGGAWTFLA